MNTGKYFFFQLVFIFLTCVAGVSSAKNSNQFYNLNEDYGISIRETNQVYEGDDGFLRIP